MSNNTFRDTDFDSSNKPVPAPLSKTESTASHFYSVKDVDGELGRTKKIRGNDQEKEINE